MNGNLRNSRLFYFLNIIIPLAIGLILYLSLRKDSYVSLLANTIIHLPNIPEQKLPTGLVAFLRNFASDILWAYALTFAVECVLGYNKKSLLLHILICVCFVVLIELVQKIGIFNGTFDLLDILFEGFSICLAIQIIKKHEEAQNEKNRKNT